MNTQQLGLPRINITTDTLVIEYVDGTQRRVPLSSFPQLAGATPDELACYSVDVMHRRIGWPARQAVLDLSEFGVSAPDHPDERRELRRTALRLAAYLLSMNVLTLTLLVFLLSGSLDVVTDAKLPLIGVLAAAFTATISALVSVSDRVCNGWEFSDGSTYPDDKPRERFNERLTILFLMRPFLGGAVGLITYAGVVGGFLIASSSGGEQSVKPEALAFFACLSGLFAKTLVDRLRETFKVLLGAAPPQKTAPSTNGRPKR